MACDEANSFHVRMSSQSNSKKGKFYVKIEYRYSKQMFKDLPAKMDHR